MGALRRAWMERRTVRIWRAGDHLSAMDEVSSWSEDRGAPSKVACGSCSKRVYGGVDGAGGDMVLRDKDGRRTFEDV